MSNTDTDRALNDSSLAHRGGLTSFAGYPWLMVCLGAAAMLATLPGRTHGLGMITERLLNDPVFGLDRVQYGRINLWATLIGACFCPVCGRLMDRWGSRTTLLAVVLSLAAVVLTMPHLTSIAGLAVAVMLTRGFGQSALSVVSLTLVGKWFRRGLGQAMGVYSILVSLGFMGAFAWGTTVRTADWRVVWSQMGWGLVAFAVVAWVLVRNADSSPPETEPADTSDSGLLANEPGLTLRQALGTPAFWVFGIGSAAYGLISSGVSLFNESLLTERGFQSVDYYKLSMLTTACALVSNLTGGAIAGRRPSGLGKLMAAALGLLATALFCYPHISEDWHLVVYGIAMGCSGGIVTVVFFTAWGSLFGRPHLGQIQGVAQMLTVFASAVGPLLLAECRASYNSYVPAITTLGGVSAVLAVSAWVVPCRSLEQTVELQNGKLPETCPAQEG